MKIKSTEIEGCYEIELDKIIDERGFFARSFCQSSLQKATGLNFNLLQRNTSYSKFKGTFRGMHYQQSPNGEEKIIHCNHGSIIDFVFDMRPKSKTFQKLLKRHLTSVEGNMLLIPKGCAHGFLTLEDDVQVTYLVSEVYSPQSELGLSVFDQLLGISELDEIKVISDKDKSHRSYTPLIHNYKE